ncbi:hypothetical protein BGX28_002912 [Mortierella sp. GBA30]|nr:hypothetical protein BGX28_002912 [Mortierella sp. GBA30]
MTRTSRSYRSTTPKEPKEAKADKRKRLENYRVAKQQAKKFVIPGILAVLVCLFLLFGSLYGFKGSKMQPRDRTRQEVLFEEARKQAAAAADSNLEATRQQVKEDFMKVLQEIPVEDPKD